MNESQNEINDSDDDAVMQDDIIIDGTDLHDFEDSELETQVFYPEGWREPAKSLDDNSEPQL